MLYSIYDKVRHNRFFSSLIAFLHIAYQRFLGKSTKPPQAVMGNGKIKVAFVCDEMTWQNFTAECQGLFITPRGWRHALESFQPDLFFCESAWSGIDRYKDCWRGQIYKTNRYFFENRKVLLDIISYCKEKGIPTVFWNKEDPVYFEDAVHNFSDTALKFDYVYTTAIECVSKYQALGHSQVDVLMFGYSPYLFYLPKNENDRKNTVVFAGSWYGDQKERCQDLANIFDEVINRGLTLEIYDRQWQSGKEDFIFPAKYQAYLHKSVPYEQLGEIYRNAGYVININTVKDSETMFARRVFEAMACGCIIISNSSLGLKNIFGEKIWFMGEPFNHDKEAIYRKENFDYVHRYHSNTQCVAKVFDVLDSSLQGKGDDNE